MEAAINTPAPMSEQPDFDAKVQQFGREIFSAIGKEQPGAFNMNYWSGWMMKWAMLHPEFKTAMFQFVDVLPSLGTSAAIASHVSEYLAPPAAKINRMLGWALRVPPHSLRAKLMAFSIRKGVVQMARQFIAGSDPRNALKPLKAIRKRGLAFTVDLLGEFSVSEKEAVTYLHRYFEALDVLGEELPFWDESAALMPGHPGESSPLCISVKLSALYSQCSSLNFERSVAVLSERLGEIAKKTKELKALLYVDAEDSANNQIIYETFKAVFSSPALKELAYPGIVVQAYAKGADKVLEDLLAFSQKRGAPIAVRLVKGAYWDSETILSRQQHTPSPLFAKKESTDANYEKLSRYLIDNHEHLFPAFASHNIRSLSHACCYAAERGLTPAQFELQMLYGMADPIANAFAHKGFLARLYVPLGAIVPGMGYLVRRLLENTSNESFLKHTFFDQSDVGELLKAPLEGP